MNKVAQKTAVRYRLQTQKVAPLVSMLLLSSTALTAQANPDPAPKLNMVIFNQSPPRAAPPPQPLVIEQSNSNNSPLQMVIFNQDAPMQNNAPAVAAASQPQADSAEQPEPETSIVDDLKIKPFLKAGYQRNDLNWTIADPSGKPNILSELQWKKVESAVVETRITVTYADTWQAEGNFGYGYTLNGRNQDSDYHANDRQNEFSRSYSVSQDGSIFYTSGSVGYRLNLGNKSGFSVSVIPKVGYAYHTQQFGDSQGVQVIPADGNFGNGGLNSTYDASWFGPWAGVGTEMHLGKRLSLQSSIAYHFAKYEGVGNWLLRGDFQHPASFRHSAYGEGIVASAGMGYALDSEWTVRLSANYQRWKARSRGLDTSYFSDGTKGETRLNQVNWTSYGFNLGVEYSF